MPADRPELKQRLSPLQYQVACQCGTEPPFDNEFWNHKEPGIYTDVISGKPLFASLHKFDSGTGWPSFWQPLDETEMIEVADHAHGMTRIEIRSKTGDAHLGHVFTDGPPPTGRRYCINSASLRFVSVDELEAVGLGEYRPLFD